jgi:hypothetical protein
MRLNVNGQVFSIGQLGPNFLILDDPTDHPVADGEIVVSIDGRERRWRVQLLDGISPSRPRTTYTAAAGLSLPASEAPAPQ